MLKLSFGYRTEGILQIVIAFFTRGIGAITPVDRGTIYLTKCEQGLTAPINLEGRLVLGTTMMSDSARPKKHQK
jgi:hypothetical protein